MDGRDVKGRFNAGNKLGQGRPQKTDNREKYLKTFYEVFTIDIFRQVVSKAIHDSVGTRIIDEMVEVKDQQGVVTGSKSTGRRIMIDDAESTAASRNAARTWLANYAMGRPIQATEIDIKSGESKWFEIFEGVTDDELDKLDSKFDSLIEKANAIKDATGKSASE